MRRLWPVAFQDFGDSAAGAAAGGPGGEDAEADPDAVLPAQNGIGPPPTGSVPFMCYKVQHIAKMSDQAPDSSQGPMLLTMAPSPQMGLPKAPEQYSVYSSAPPPDPSAACVPLAPDVVLLLARATAPSRATQPELPRRCAAASPAAIAGARRQAARRARLVNDFL
eukprot:TRINITY_DN25521_c0_g6_i1.p1 TRINITY_DN25521_c0_g6~~TRINITY_DN25521_c0_g6_i1.p1  ORF type:complete len:166 (-),score=38.88 TRINITY_DN25521_c0_g6_i1:115-612(-)